MNRIFALALTNFILVTFPEFVHKIFGLMNKFIKNLLASPLNNALISSTFEQRFTPVLTNSIIRHFLLEDLMNKFKTK